MAVVVSPLNIFQGKLCGILSRYLTPLVPAWYRFAAFFYPILLIFGAFLLISVFCVAFCHDVWHLLTPLGFALRLFHPILLQFLLISMCCVPHVWCFKACHEQVMSVVVSSMKVFRVKCGRFCHDVSASWRRSAAFSSRYVELCYNSCWFEW